MRLPTTMSLRHIGALAWLFTALAAYATTATQSVIYTFPGAAVPSPLIQASDGNLYGSTASGGTSNMGYVFRLTTGGAPAILYSFTGAADGGLPYGNLIEGNDGNLYGTCTSGGSGNGTLFRMTLGGAITVLHTFATADGTSPGSLIEDNAGNFFGTTFIGGGAAGDGTVFEYSAAGVFSVIHTFTDTGNDGAHPNTPLLEASDGLIYGDTVRGGPSGSFGTLFRFDPANPASFTSFAFFPIPMFSDSAANPTFGMTEGPDGALYGLTAEGGTGYGTMYKVTLGSSPMLNPNVASLNGGSLGGLPQSGLTLGGDGNFYATTSDYGPDGPGSIGTIFQFVPGTSTINPLYDFITPNGNATGAPIEAADGNFYGPASLQIYKLVLSPTIPVPVTLTASAATITLGQSVTLAWDVTNAFSNTAKNCFAHGAWSGSMPLSGTDSVTPSAAGSHTYALTCGGVESALVSLTVKPAVSSQTATPAITPNGGSFSGPQVYNITDATPGAMIYYTTDGSMPNTTSAVWNGIPTVLILNTTIKAIAIASPLTASNVASATFVISNNTAQNCTIDYSGGFQSHAGLQLNHGAAILGSLLQLTDGKPSENRSAFQNVRIPVKTFVTEFDFRFNNANASSADGLTFTLQANSPSALGGNGGGLGYNGIPNSMALKFDLYNNAGEGPNSVGIFFGGAFPYTPAVDLTPSGVNLHSGHIMQAYVTWDSSWLTLDLTDTVTAAHFTHSFPLPATNPFGSASAYAGFTAATGALTSTAQVLYWGLQSEGACNPQ